MTYIVGLGHYKRTGKDQFANFLIEALGCWGLTGIKRSFAWKLKQICHELYAWDGLREPEFYDSPEGEGLREVPLPTIGKSPRQIWIDFGTPAVRDNVYEPTWVDYLIRSQHDADVLVVPDVRFPNEVNAIRAKGGYLIKVVRPGYGPGDNVPDRALLKFSGWDRTIGRAGTLDSLREEASKLASEIKSQN